MIPIDRLDVFKLKPLLSWLPLLALLITIGCQDVHDTPSAIPVTLLSDDPNRNEPILPIPQKITLNPAKVELGKRLFYDRRLSKYDRLACSDCHDLYNGGIDLRTHSRSFDGNDTDVNTLTVFNAGFNVKQTWSGKFDTPIELIDSVIQNPQIMNGNWDEIITKLRQSTEYQQASNKLYQQDISKDIVNDSIAIFVMSLATPNSRFDQYLRGDDKALSEEEKQGYQLFKSYGCVSCHQGVNIGGNLFQPFGVIDDYFAQRSKIKQVDLGRFNVTGDEQDRHVFRVASLRNVELTPPYFHDGSAQTLEEAVQIMARYQLGRHLDKEQTHRIVQFLTTLTSEYRD